jgi:hypothetical protein
MKGSHRHPQPQRSGYRKLRSDADLSALLGRFRENLEVRDMCAGAQISMRRV